MAFLNANPVKGFSLFAREAGLRKRILGAGLVITGEGCLDRQSLMGKGIGELLTLCRQHEIPCVALCGRLNLSEPAQHRFSKIYALTALAGSRFALKRAAFWLAKAATKAAEELRA